MTLEPRRNDPDRTPYPRTFTPMNGVPAVRRDEGILFPLDQKSLTALVRQALDEDQAFDDVTTIATIVSTRRARGTIVARDSGVVCGTAIAIANGPNRSRRVRQTCTASGRAMRRFVGRLNTASPSRRPAQVSAVRPPRAIPRSAPMSRSSEGPCCQRPIPAELQEAAAIDGCSRLGFFWRMVLPLSLPGVITVGILAFIGSWNSYLLPLFILNDSDSFTLPLGVQAFSSEYSVDTAKVLAFTSLAMLPALLFFSLFERRIVGGLTGAVKG